MGFDGEGRVSEKLSKNPFLRYFNKFERFITRFVPDSPWGNYAVSQYRYFLDNFRFANVRNPRGFPEFLMRFKLSDEARDPIFERISDKELVKDYVAEKAGPGHTIETLAVLKSPEEVEAFVFPENCVAKPTHLSGAVIFVRAEQPGAPELSQMKNWLETNFFFLNREPNYKNLQPKVIVEPFVGEGDQSPDDIKIFCFHGEPRFIQIDYGRHGTHLRDLYDLEGRRLDVTFRHHPANRDFPFKDKIPDMVSLARQLSHGFYFLRVDLYVVGEQLLVGELTNYPTNCVIHFEPRHMDEVIGRMTEDPAIIFNPPLAKPAKA